MRDRLHAPWDDEYENSPYHIERLSDSLAKKVTYTSEEIQEKVYRLLGWIYETGRR